MWWWRRATGAFLPGGVAKAASAVREGEREGGKGDGRERERGG